MSIFSNPISAATQEAQAYTAAVLKMLGDRDPLVVLEGIVSNLESSVKDLTDDQRRRPEAPGKWSIAEVVQHLADSELVWANRLRTVVADKNPRIIGYDQDWWAERLRYRDADFEDAMERVRVLRKSNLTLIRSLSAEQMKRVGVHSERGEESIEHMVRLYAGHDLVHLKQIARIRDSLSGHHQR